ncbi:MAG: NADH-quinone oxidoreductase subunit N [Anaerolineaceae bacterium]|nr:NADH-quinone oxidoreductase subunit N [Anaerolineaceae bacterium]
MSFSLWPSLSTIAPEIGLTLLALILLFLEVYLPKERRVWIAYTSMVGMALLALTPLIWSPPVGGATAWGGMVRHDHLSQVFKVMILLAGSLTSWMAIDSTRLSKQGEFHFIIVIATLGGCLLSATADVIMLFIALETTSIPLYILAAFHRNEARSIEGGMKYFLYGAFTSAIMLFGLSLLFGFTGDTSFIGIAAALSANDGLNQISILVCMIMILVGFGFKISAVPFHFWTPDVYEGAPTPVTAFVSVASKAASFALLLRFLAAVFPEGILIEGQEIQLFWVNLSAAAAAITMTFGNVVALVQRNMKRLIAYSSIAQAGYALMGVTAMAQSGESAVASVSFYLFMYTFTNLLVFAVVLRFAAVSGSDDIRAFAGLSRRSPKLALAMTIGLLSLAGIPPTAGFFGKFFLFTAAVDAGYTWLALLGVINAIVALYYYLVVVKVMYVDRSADDEVLIALPQPVSWLLGVSCVAILLLGTIAVEVIYDWTRLGASSFISALSAAL